MSEDRGIHQTAAFERLARMEHAFLGRAEMDGLNRGEALSEWLAILIFTARQVIDRFGDPGPAAASAVRSLLETTTNEAVQ